VWLVYLRLVTVRLRTVVFRHTLRISLTGLWTLQKIPFSGITRAEGVLYNAAKEYRGYGIRSNGKDRAYIASGDRGVRLTLTGGRSILLGTQNPVALIKALGDRKFMED
jgi:hypothetical protein